MDNKLNPEIEHDSQSFPFKSSKIQRKIQKSKEISNYLIKQKIGMGSYAKVYKAIHKPTGQYVAVKVLDKSKMTNQELKNVYFEVETHKKLFHTHITRIYEFYQNEQKIYIFMELCKNGELFTYINRNGPLTQKFAAKIFKQILSALKYLKSQRLFHRDIKCENIMFDHNWNAKIVDFGFVTKEDDGSFSQTFCGSPSYTAPQLAKKQNYHSQLIDVWCLGVTLYAMLTGQLPFDGKKSTDTKSNIIEIKYQMKKFFSSSVKNIFNKIFTTQDQRATIEELENEEFCQLGYPVNPKFLNTNTDEITVDPYILELLKVQHENVNSYEVIQSATRFKLDSCYSLYYLTVQKQILKGNLNIKYDIACHEFQKRKKRSNTLKLIKVSNQRKSLLSNSNYKDIVTPEIKGKKQKFRVRQSQATIDVNNARLRKRDQSPQSPKRILDLVSAYRRRM